MPTPLHRLCIPLLLLAAGCARDPAPAGPAAPFAADVATLLDRMADPMTLPDLRVPGGRQVSSFDVTGGNNDWSHAIAASGDQWVTLADLQGPGYVTRIWGTGWSAPDNPFEFCFDDETEPRLRLTVNELFGNAFPFQPPFARQENFCYYANLPIPFAKRLVVRTKGGKRDGKTYFQINHAALPAGSAATSYPRAWGEAEKAAWKRAAAVLEAREPESPKDLVRVRRAVELKPGGTVAVEPPAGPGVIREFRVAPRLTLPADAARAQALLDEVSVRIQWNGSPHASIEAPLGDFFSQDRRLTAFRSLGSSFDGATLVNRLPMPFDSAVVTLAHAGAAPLALDVEFAVQPLTARPAHLGLLHASLQSSWPEDIGPTHAALRVKGRGKYVGGTLAIDSAATRSWWGLEGDELIRWDDAYMPQWKGTGIEDHYNGGWYYRTPLAEHLTGLLSRIPFRATQYRWLVLDAPAFAHSLDVQFERGGENEAPLRVDSTAWYYLDQPQEAENSGGGGKAEAALSIPTEKELAHHLVELERFGDHAGCRRALQLHFGAVTNASANLSLRLQDLLYRERLEGRAAVADARARLRADAAGNAAVLNVLDRLDTLHAAPANALLTVASAAPVDVWYGGAKVGTAGPGAAAFAVAAPTGPVAVAVAGTQNPDPNFLHVRLEANGREWRSDDDWRYAENPAAGWEQPGYDESAWAKHPDKWLRLATPPAAPSPWLDLYSNAENIIRPIQKAGATMVYRRVWTPADSVPVGTPR